MPPPSLDRSAAAERIVTHLRTVGSARFAELHRLVGLPVSRTRLLIDLLVRSGRLERRGRRGGARYHRVTGGAAPVVVPVPQPRYAAERLELELVVVCPHCVSGGGSCHGCGGAGSLTFGQALIVAQDAWPRRDCACAACVRLREAGIERPPAEPPAPPVEQLTFKAHFQRRDIERIAV